MPVQCIPEDSGWTSGERNEKDVIFFILISCQILGSLIILVGLAVSLGS